MKTIRKALALCLALALVLTAIPVSNTSAAVKTAKLSKSSVTVAGNATKQQTKSVKVTTNADWKNVKVTASSADKKVATVAVSKKTVKVTAVKKGTTSVTVKVTGKKSGKKVSKKLTLKVTVCGAGLSAKAPAELTVGDTAKISVKTTPSTAVCTYDVDKKAVATVSDDGTITAVAAGTAKVVVRTDYGKEKILTVTVKEAAAKMTGIKQTASNIVIAEFSSDVSKTYTKDDFAMVSADGTSVLAIKSVEFSADGKSAKVVAFTNFVNNTEYKISCKDLSASFTAKIGAVSRIVIDTASAEQNVETKITFKLFDADGIDVTNSVELDTTCFVTADGNYSSASLEKASKASITMVNVGDSADVTVSYNSNVTGAEDVVATQKITCVDAKAAQGTKTFWVDNGDPSYINDNSDCAKFYLGFSDSMVTVWDSTSKATSPTIYFCAKDGNDVVSYDSYEVESSNDDVMSVVIGTADSGKFATFVVTGNTPGSAQINIKASKNGKDTYYTVPVTVKSVPAAASMKVSIDKTTVSNVKDADYLNTIRTVMYDKDGQSIDAKNSGVTYDYEVETDATSPVSIVAGSDYWQPWDNTMTVKVSAWNANAKAYTIKITAYDPVSGKTFVKRVAVTVKNFELKQGLKMTYQIELVDRSALDVSPMATYDDKLQARLYATCNGLFAGYVRGGNDGTVTIGDASEDIQSYVSNDTKISNVVVYAKLGTKKFNYDLINATTGAGMALGNGTSSTTWFSPVDDNATSFLYDTKLKSSAQLAKLGTYTVEYKMQMVSDPTKDVYKSRSFTVNNSVVIPVVTVVTRTVDSFSDMTEAFKTSVDMNNNTNEHVSLSIPPTVTVNNTTISNIVDNTDHTKKTIKYVEVVDNYNNGGKNWKFLIPVNATLQED